MRFKKGDKVRVNLQRGSTQSKNNPWTDGMVGMVSNVVSGMFGIIEVIFENGREIAFDIDELRKK